MSGFFRRSPSHTSHSLNSLAIDLVEIAPKVAGHVVSFRLTLSNHGDVALLLPFPRVTGLQLTDVESSRVCGWYSHLMVNSSSTPTFTLEPAANRAFDLHARFQGSEIEHSDYDVSDFCRWCTDMTVGKYVVQYRFTVDDDCFDPDSHARLRHLERDADEQNVSAWAGLVESTPINVERRAT